MQTSLTKIVSRTAATLAVVSLCAGLAHGQSLEHASDSPGKNIIHIHPGTGVGPSGPTSTGGTVTTSSTVTPTSISPPLTYNGGPVMRNPVNYLIFWTPKTSPQYAAALPAPGSYQTGIETFFQKIGGTPLYNIVTQYTDGSGAPPNSASWGGSWVDTNTTPPSGCNGTATGAVGATPNCPLTDADIQNEVEAAIKANPGWQVSNVNVEYFVYTPSNVGECSGVNPSPPKGNGLNSCFTINGGVGPGESADFCAYHSYSGSNRIYAFMPFGSNGACYPFFSTPFPNGATLDIVLSTSSHEMIESNTDPHIDGWLDSTGAEIGDKCAYQYGFVAPDGTDLLLNGNRYLIQTEWSNQVGGCAKRLSPFTDTLNIPQTLNFGDVLAGGSSSKTLSTTNSGAAGSGNAANIIYTRLSASSDFAFSLPGVPPNWATLSSGATFPVSVLFAPFLPPRNATGAVIIDTDETPCDSTLLPKSGNSCSVSLSEIVNPLIGAVVTPPTISKAFGAASIPLGTNTSLSFTITNPNTVVITGVGFTDTLPPGLTASAVSGSCGGGIISTGPPVSLTGAALATGTSCTFSVTVTGTTPGVKNNVTGNVTSNEAGSGNQASATLQVIAPPVITKSFLPNKFIPGGTTTVSFSIANPNSFAALTGVAFTDTLPSGLSVASPNGLSSTCGGAATAGASTVSLSGGSIPSSAACTVTATVTAPEGVYLNSVQVTSTNGGTGNTSSGTVYVATPPSLSKVFGAVSIGAGSSTTLSFTLMNPNHVVTLDALQFSDTLPAGLVISTPSVIAGSCDGGTIIAPAGNNLITMGSASLAPQTSCAFSVNVTSDGTVLGSLTNTTSTVTSTEALPGGAASATIFIGNPFQVSYGANLNIGESYIDVANTGASGAPLLGPGFGAAVGNICVNVYAFDPGEELIACCSCLITPDQTVNLGVNRDLTVKTLTGVIPTSVTIKLLSTLAGGDGTGASCTNSAATVTSAPLANGMSGWGTTLHATPAAGGYATTERPFTGVTLSAGELASVGGRCAAILGNGSGFGVCNSCRPGALGGSKLP